MTKGLLISIGSPTTPNNTTTVTSATGFSIGFSGAAGAGSYNYSTSVSEDITDWSIAQLTSAGGQQISWSYYQNFPWQCDDPGATVVNDIVSSQKTWIPAAFEWKVIAGGSKPGQPPALSTSSITMAPMSTWINNVAVGEIDMKLTGSLVVTNLAVYNGAFENEQRCDNCAGEFMVAFSCMNLPMS
jgi:hypothetical protein